MTDTYDRVISRLATILASLQDVEPLVERLCEAGRQMLRADGAAIALPTDTETTVTACATDELSAHLEDEQVVVGQGPTIGALETAKVSSADLGRPEQPSWPLFGERAHELGFDGVLTAVPMMFEDQVVGVLCVRHRTYRPEADREIHLFLGTALAAALLEDPSTALWDRAADDGWVSQAKVHQATGMIIAQVRVRPADALALLRGQAFSTGSTLLEVAEHVIAKQINFRDFTVEGD